MKARARRCMSQLAGDYPGVWCALRPGHEANGPHVDPTGRHRWRNGGEVWPRLSDYDAAVTVAAVAVLATSIVCHVTPDDLLGRSRIRAVALARHVAVATIRAETPLSLPQIAVLIGRDDHTTILNSIRRATTDPVLAARTGEVRALVASVIPRGGQPVDVIAS